MRGAQLAEALGLAGAPSEILFAIRAAANECSDSDPSAPRVLGVDDWPDAKVSGMAPSWSTSIPLKPKRSVELRCHGGFEYVLGLVRESLASGGSGVAGVMDVPYVAVAAAAIRLCG